MLTSCTRTYWLMLKILRMISWNDEADFIKFLSFFFSRKGTWTMNVSELRPQDSDFQVDPPASSSSPARYSHTNCCASFKMNIQPKVTFACKMRAPRTNCSDEQARAHNHRCELQESHGWTQSRQKPLFKDAVLTSDVALNQFICLLGNESVKLN
jgi:hypothetical protein